MSAYPQLVPVVRLLVPPCLCSERRVFRRSGQMRRLDIRMNRRGQLERYRDAGEGVLLCVSHLGSFEVLRVLARNRPDASLRVVLDKGHNPALTDLLDALDPKIAATVIDGGQDGTAKIGRAHVCTPVTNAQLV